MDSVVTLLGDEYPDVVRVRVGEQLYTVAKDTPITIGTDGQIIYDGTTHSITIEKGTVEGDVTIYASTEKYNVTNTLSHIISKNGNGTTIVEKTTQMY